MKKLLLLLLTALFAANCLAQTDVKLPSELGLRLSLMAEKELARGLHAYLSEEVRLDNNLGAFDRFHTTIGLTYKLTDNVKLGLGYALIAPYSSTRSEFKSIRHRMMLDGRVRFFLGQSSRAV